MFGDEHEGIVTVGDVFEGRVRGVHSATRPGSACWPPRRMIFAAIRIRRYRDDT